MLIHNERLLRELRFFFKLQILLRVEYKILKILIQLKKKKGD